MQKIEKYMKEQQMLSKGDRVVIGLSGGPDSVCLFSVLNELKAVLELELIAVHLNHQLRGAAATADEEFVTALCQEHQVELVVERADVKAYGCLHKLSSEEAGRKLRHQLFQETLEKYGANKIALGHHMDDNAETFLLNLCRGSGVLGLTGIKPVSFPYIRPLLCVQKEEIMTYLEGRGLAYVIDETNCEDEYTRNKIRNHVLPYLTEQVNQQTILHINESANRLEALAAFAREALSPYLKRGLIATEGGGLLAVESVYREVPPALRGEFLLEFLSRVSEKREDLGRIHVRQLEELFEKQGGRLLDLPYEIQARRTYDGVLLQKKKEQGGGKVPQPEIRIFEIAEKLEKFPRGTYTKWFDYDRIKDSLAIRNRGAGDYLTINKNGDKKKLKQFFIDEKIDRDKRAEIPLVCDGNHVMWVVGYRQSPYYQVSEQTRTVVEISFEKEITKNGRIS
ncbi:tRNA(Ile)-lysidine synthase [Lachnospiraceae bacterium PF1-21]